MSPETPSRRSFLGLEGQHVFITGAAGAIGGEAVREFLGKFVRLCSLFFFFFFAWVPGIDFLAVCWHSLIGPLCRNTWGMLVQHGR